MGFASPPRTNADTGALVRSLLRQADQYSHKLLDNHPMLHGLSLPGYPLHRYRQLLLSLLPLYQALEARITNFIDLRQVDFDYRKRNKSSWLLQDIRYFGDPVPEAAAHPAIDRLDSIGELVGMLFVIEGATLSGRGLSKSLQENYGLTQLNGACFFNGYAELTPRRWLEFVHFSDAIYQDAEQLKAAEQVSCKTFNLFLKVLDTSNSALSAPPPMLSGNTEPLKFSTMEINSLPY